MNAGSGECEKPSFAVTIGEIEIGPTNDLVKIMVGAGKLAKEALDRVGENLSRDKIEGWQKDPVGSFQRSDPGKAVETIGEGLNHLGNETKKTLKKLGID